MRGQRQAMGDTVWGSQRPRRAWWGKKNSGESTMRLEGLGGFIMASWVQRESRDHDSPGDHGGMRDNRMISVCIKATMVVSTWFCKIIKITEQEVKFQGGKKEQDHNMIRMRSRTQGQPRIWKFMGPFGM